MRQPVENDGTEPYPSYTPSDIMPNYVGIVLSHGGQWICIANEGDQRWRPCKGKKESNNPYGAERD